MNHSELAALLNSLRARIRPSDGGLSTGPRRRAPGAGTATRGGGPAGGLSADYYTELERGRGV
ncbi:hypothetical protein [Streptomyces canus]|uniref:hypothetical protein n=1 Tax=Streptomyces canus TaxID=58343 RepID=UPI003864DDC3